MKKLLTSILPLVFVLSLFSTVHAGEIHFQDSNGVEQARAVSPQHPLPVQIDIPTTIFEEVLTAEKTPQVQIKFPYGVNSREVHTLLNNTSGGSAVTAANSVVSITAAGTYPSFAQIRTLDTIRYGPGQGSEAKWTAAFPTDGVALSSQSIGAGDDDEGLFVGYKNTAFGFMHVSHGELENRSLTITAVATGTGNITITLDGTAVTVAVAASDTIAEVTAKIVAQAAAFGNAGRGWEVHTDDNVSVEFISMIAEPAAGTFSFVDTDTTGVTAGTFAQGTVSILGVVPGASFIAQTDWNVDNMDGTGSPSNPSGVELARGITPGDNALAIENLNVYGAAWQYLGAGVVEFRVERPNGDWVIVHRIHRAGSSTATTLKNPTLHMTAIVKTESSYSGGNLTVQTASMAGFIQGKESDIGIRFSAHGQKSIATTTQNNVLTVHSDLEYNGTRNKINSYPDFLTITNEVTKGITVWLTVNPTEVSGTVALTAVDAGNTPMEYDTAGTLVVGGDVLFPIDIAGDGVVIYDMKNLGLFLRPGDRWVFSAAKTTGGTSGVVGIGLTWKDRL